MLRRDPNSAAAMRALGEPLAAELGVDHDAVIVIGPRTGEEWAFSFVRFGASLLLNLAERDGYPAIGGKARRQGARAVLRTFGSKSAERGTVFLAHAMFEHMVATQTAYGETESAEAYRNVRWLLDKYYPLSPREQDQLDACSEELHHLEHGTAPRMARNGFHISAARGEDPRQDLELVEVQRRAVGTFFRRTAAASAIEICVGPKAFENLGDSFAWPSLMSADVLPLNAGEQAVWTSVGQRFADHVSDFLDALPSS